VRFGLSYNHYTARSENFSDVQEARYDVFASFRYAIAAPWIVNVNVRQSLYDDRYAPFSPSLGTEVHLFKKPGSAVTLRAIVSRGFRVPTLNDRYYMPGGNPLIGPEDALHAEGGLVWTRTSGEVEVSTDATYYQSAIDNMIVWQPGDDGVWSPSNLQKVNIRGAEFSSRLSNRSGIIRVSAGMAYSFTQSLNSKGASPSLDNKQLPYIPRHKTNVFASFSNKTNWKLDITYAYTGVRYISLDNIRYDALDPFGIADIAVSKKQVFKKWSAEVKAEVRNVSDLYYESLQNVAMPGRNYAISLFIKL
jgi:iron complex outermembrane receptor protein